MIPEFDNRGCLPPGIYPASIDEVAQRFGRSSEQRRDLMQSLVWLMDMVRREDISRLLLNGSFVTNDPEPGDVDCVALIGSDFGRRGISRHEWMAPIPYIHMEMADEQIFDEYVRNIFGKDAANRPKGIIEVIL